MKYFMNKFLFLVFKYSLNACDHLTLLSSELANLSDFQNEVLEDKMFYLMFFLFFLRLSSHPVYTLRIIS